MSLCGGTFGRVFFGGSTSSLFDRLETDCPDCVLSTLQVPGPPPLLRAGIGGVDMISRDRCAGEEDLVSAGLEGEFLGESERGGGGVESDMADRAGASAGLSQDRDLNSNAAFSRLFLWKKLVNVA
ncbi:hypothetical protein WMY93_021032 [Mugilogobius chulae]|uniref:Uncharacterized protein n=1 Tax=Mugilogobius chulae TaxID=88201 RepID=A0AAW0NEF8_9GOBI